MANIYSEKAAVEPFGTSRFRTYTGPITLAIKSETVGTDTSITDNFPPMLDALSLSGSFFFYNDAFRMILSADDEDDATYTPQGESAIDIGNVTRFSYIANGSIATLTYSRDLGRVFLSDADLAAYLNPEEENAESTNS